MAPYRPGMPSLSKPALLVGRTSPATRSPAPASWTSPARTFADSHGLAPVLDGQAAVLAASAPVRHVLNLLQQHPSQLRAAVLLRRGRPRRLSNIATRSATATQTHRALLDRGGEHSA